MATTRTDESGIQHNYVCWNRAESLVIVEAQSTDETISTGTDMITEWDVTVSELAGTWLANGTVGCEC